MAAVMADLASTEAAQALGSQERAAATRTCACGPLPGTFQALKQILSDVHGGLTELRP
jgi:hypothetical protein